MNSISDDINFHKKEIQILKSEKDTLENILTQKANDVKKVMADDVKRVDDEMKRTF